MDDDYFGFSFLGFVKNVENIFVVIVVGFCFFDFVISFIKDIYVIEFRVKLRYSSK